MARIKGKRTLNLKKPVSVYCMEVPGNENFLVDIGGNQGVFAHNCKSYNLDFDGDQVMFQLTVDPLATEECLEKNTPLRKWFYEKTLEPVYSPKDESLFGLFRATNKGKEIEREYLTCDEAILDNGLEIDDVFKVEGRKTTKGRELVSRILDVSYKDFMGDEAICASNINSVVERLYSLPEYEKKVKELNQLGSEVVTDYGVPYVSPSLFSVKADDPLSEEICNSDLTQEEKEYLLLQRVGEKTKEVLKKFPSLSQIIESSGRIKSGIVGEILAPRLMESVKGENPFVSRTSLVSGESGGSYLRLAETNRQILEAKQNIVPKSGYASNQLVVTQESIIFSSEENPNPDKKGVYLPDFAAEGRVDLEGNRIHGAKGKVLVRSCINNEDNDNVYTDELSSSFLNKIQLSHGSRLGINFGMTLTEWMTQNALKLKHGGSLYYYNRLTIKAEERCRFKTEKDNCYIFETETGKEIKYYKSERSSVCKGEIFEKGDLIIQAFRREYADRALSEMECLLGVSGGGMKHKINRKEEKGLCYSPYKGKIKYSKTGVLIGNKEIPYVKKGFYNLPEGTEVDIGDRLCEWSILDPQHYAKIVPLSEVFFALYRNYRDIVGYDLPAELLEPLFKKIKDNQFSVRKTLSHSQNRFVTMMMQSAKTVITESWKDGGSRIEDTSSLMQTILGE